MEKGDLKSVLRATRPRRSGSSELTKRRMVLLGADVAEGMGYLASVSIVHRDLAARNCLVSDDLVAKVRCWPDVELSVSTVLHEFEMVVD